MSAYLGTLGRLVPIYSTPTMGVSGIPARSYETTLEGRVKVQVRPIGRRSWDLSAEYANPAEVGTLMGFASGEWGHGPFVWVSPTAPGANMLTPAQASCDPVTLTAAGTASGPLALGDGSWAGRSFSNPNPANDMYFGNTPCPVVPGVPVTISAHLSGVDAQVGASFFTADGTYVSALRSPVVGSSAAKRISATGVAPTNAAYLMIYGVGTVQGARPAVTWTDDLMGWGAGEGCTKAVVDAVDRTALRSSREPNGPRYSNLSFTIREVG